MPSLVAPLFDALEQHRQRLTDQLAALPGAAASTAPAPDAWSLAQIVDHFVRIEQSVRPAGRDGSAWERATGPFRAGLVRTVLALPVRIAVPPGADAIRPDAAPDLAERLAAWAALRADWAAHLATADAEALGRMVLRHPLAGRFAWPDTLRFLLAHHRHHDAQVARTLAAVGAGRAA